MIDLTIARCEVNAAHRNKRVLFDEHDHERITNSIDGCGGKKYFAPARAETAPPGAQVMPRDARGIPIRGGPVIHSATIGIAKSISRGYADSGSCSRARAQEMRRVMTGLDERNHSVVLFDSKMPLKQVVPGITTNFWITRYLSAEPLEG